VKLIAVVIATLVAAGAAALAYVYAGQYDVAADSPHWQLTQRILATIRERSIAVSSARLKPPDLADPELIARGAEHYRSMCVGCHLAPGKTDTELREGLNPAPPNLSQPAERNAAETFWVVKHGIKMSGMPAWGRSHDDQTLWAIVALVQQLPTLTVSEYRALTKRRPSSDEEHHEHAHVDTGRDTDGLLRATGATIRGVGGNAHAHAGEGEAPDVP
jgi:mono/diheme cytochrome c family protein